MKRVHIVLMVTILLLLSLVVFAGLPQASLPQSDRAVGTHETNSLR